MSLRAWKCSGAHRVLTRVPGHISKSNDVSKIDCFTVHLLYVMYAYIYMYILHVCIVITFCCAGRAGGSVDNLETF